MPREERRFAARIERLGVILAAEAAIPAGDDPAPAVLFVHGLGSGKDSPRNLLLSELLFDAGFATVRIDLSSHGESSEDKRGIDAFPDDVVAAAEWTASLEGVDPTRVGIAATSAGARGALQAVNAGRIAPAALVLRAPVVNDDVYPRRTTIPTLIIIGDEDGLFPKVGSMSHDVEGVTLVIVPGASHNFEEEGALERVVEETVGWFQRHLGGIGG